jgi:alcohol dehydrogenase
MIFIDNNLRIVNFETDFSGVIKYLGGEDVSSDLKIGDEVYGQASTLSGGSGAFAELALANKVSRANQKH